MQGEDDDWAKGKKREKDDKQNRCSKKKLQERGGKAKKLG